MDTELLVLRALAMIQSGEATRDDQLARLLDSDIATVLAALAPSCASGALVSCRIERAGSTPVNEYRFSAVGPRPGSAAAQPKKPPIPTEQVLAAARAAPAPKPPRSAPIEPRGEPTMTTREKILAALRKLGPMTTGQMSNHVDAKWLSTIAHQMAKSGELKILGGGKRSSIYGLPGQTPLAESGESKTERKVRKPQKAAKKCSAPLRKVQRKTARKVQKTVFPAKALDGARKARNPKAPRPGPRIPYVLDTPGPFRTAIASDGAMIFLGAEAGPFELNRAESRAVIEFVRTIDAGTAGA